MDEFICNIIGFILKFLNKIISMSQEDSNFKVPMAKINFQNIFAFGSEAIVISAQKLAQSTSNTL